MPEKKALLELQNIGKIYVSEGNVAVGIRGVNLAFDRGEFVAVTGASGSGKSTLLNVISGMDTFEEGELLIDGEPTSHYLQKDWESYREEYISFIFQDYNIIESFTVLQNVELALLSIENTKARREKAMELLRRVGLEKHLHHKGSKLSGGQKQRTVIARALAKDSPIILADEPTGNLDSQSSKEIINLLREISHDKLVIVVTHNFEEVEACATRHIRVFDGSIELDHKFIPTEAVIPIAPSGEAIMPPSRTQKTKRTLKDGILLGRVRFKAMPKLSVFLCCLMVLTSLVLTLISASNYEATGLFDKSLMFTHMDGRTVIVRQDGGIITDAELEALATELGAEKFMHYDYFLDRTVSVRLGDDWDYSFYQFGFGFPAEDVKLDAGRYPEAIDEIILEVPISVKRYLGENGFEETAFPMLFDMATYRVVGVKYYYDNTRTPRMLFTEDGYRLASALAFFSEQKHNFGYRVEVSDPTSGMGNMISTSADTFVDLTATGKSYYIQLKVLSNGMDDGSGNKVPPDDQNVKVELVGNFYKQNSYDNFFGEDIYYDGMAYEKAIYYPLDMYTRLKTLPGSTISDLEGYYYERWIEGTGIPGADFVVLSPDVFMDFMYEHYYAKHYTQASLFFKNDRTAHELVEPLRARGYVAVVSDETVEADVSTMILVKLGLLVSALGWAASVIFATAFLSLCSGRAMNATRGDIAIMRSMGIPTGVVRVSIYVQTLIALIPAFIVTAITCTVIYMTPATNYMFSFLHAGDYAILAIVLVAIAMNLSRKQAAKMFHESVKKTLKGGKKS